MKLFTPGLILSLLSVRDGRSEKVGTASQFINIPDTKKDRLTLSGIALSSYDPKDEENKTNATGVRSTSDTSGESALTQAALRRFRAVQVLRFAYAIYNAKVEKRTKQHQLTTRLRLYREGLEIFTGRETPYEPTGGSDLDRLLAEGGLQLNGFKAGQYVLEVSVTDRLASAKYQATTNWIDFEIVK